MNALTAAGYRHMGSTVTGLHRNTMLTVQKNGVLTTSLPMKARLAHSLTGRNGFEQRRRFDASVLARMHSLRRSLTDYVKQLPDAATYLHDDGGYLSAPRRYLRPVSVQHRWVSNLTDDEASSDVVEDDVT